MHTLPSVLVLGARGRFGQAAVRAFTQAGWRVTAQMRPGATAVPGVGVGAGAEWVGVSPDDTPALAAAAGGASVVVQALSPVYTHKVWRREVPRLTDAAIAVSRQLGATLLLPASVYNYGEQLPPELREETAQAATTVKGRLRIESEQRIEQATGDGRMNAVVIRGGDFFGSGQGSWLDQVMVKDLRRGKFTYPGPLDQQHAWAYLPDMAQAFVRVAAQRERLPAFDTMHFGGHSVTGQDWAAALGVIAHEQGWLAQGRTLKCGSLPWPLLRALGVFAPTFEALSEMRYLWRRPHRLVNTRMQALIGPEQHTPFVAAVRGALADLGFLTAPALPAVDPRAAVAG